MLDTLRTLITVAVFALVAQPAAASDSGATNLVETTVTGRHDGTRPGTGADDALANGHEMSYQWNQAGAELPATRLLPDEPTSRLQTIEQVALGLLMIVLVTCGLAIAITSLRADIRQRRVAYHRRVRT